MSKQAKRDLQYKLQLVTNKLSVINKTDLFYYLSEISNDIIDIQARLVQDNNKATNETIQCIQDTFNFVNESCQSVLVSKSKSQ